ncbi:hypothetical protein [Paenibacillus sp. WLX2291]|uniref:hypothetical protein n=1 Tax=Paenibacillus sp. WLX2291 TaxID=3296934 RepID=UPI0039842993
MSVFDTEKASPTWRSLFFDSAADCFDSAADCFDSAADCFDSAADCFDSAADCFDSAADCFDSAADCFDSAANYFDCVPSFCYLGCMRDRVFRIELIPFALSCNFHIQSRQ